MRNSDVVAAVPNFNMGDSLGELLPVLLEQEYQGVFVLDDASTDHSVEVVRSFQGDVSLVAGDMNVGSGANRNRVLGHIQSGILHFIDADMVLHTSGVPELARELMSRPNAAIVGGLVKNLNGQPFVYNYGPKLNALSAITAPLQEAYGKLLVENPERARTLRSLFGIIAKEWPDPLETPVAHEVFWVSEANMLVDAAAFARVGGFDPHLRFHEIQDLAMKFHRRGLRRFFDPAIETTHKAIEVRENRQIDAIKAYLRLIGRYGLRQLI